ncbi:hypothetical protein F5Y08DRAFT_47265 [Xylaria arbuscula]|nr:hypothetical protein F5Y08DRAFT_47265 [Xylaria arbuscula]
MSAQLSSINAAIGSLDLAVFVYKRRGQICDLPPAFDKVAKALELTSAALNDVYKHIRDSTPVANKIPDSRATERLEHRAQRLCNIFEPVFPGTSLPNDQARIERYRAAAGRGGRVELLMKEILEGVLVIAKESIISEERVKALQAFLTEMEHLPRSLEEEPGNTFNNFGPGPQAVHMGEGAMNMNTGSGYMCAGDMYVEEKKGSKKD